MAELGQSDGKRSIKTGSCRELGVLIFWKHIAYKENKIILLKNIIGMQQIFNRCYMIPNYFWIDRCINSRISPHCLSNVSTESRHFLDTWSKKRGLGEFNINKRSKSYFEKQKPGTSRESWSPKP